MLKVNPRRHQVVRSCIAVVLLSPHQQRQNFAVRGVLQLADGVLRQPEIPGLAPIPILLAVAHEYLERYAAAARAAGYIYDIINLAPRRPAFGGPVAAP